MTFSKEKAVLQGMSAFSDVVEKACVELMDRQIQHSIKRIQQMEEDLNSLEKELDDFLQEKGG